MIYYPKMQLSNPAAMNCAQLFTASSLAAFQRDPTLHQDVLYTGKASTMPPARLCHTHAFSKVYCSALNLFLIRQSSRPENIKLK